MDFISRQQAAAALPHIWTDGRTPQPPAWPGNMERKNHLGKSHRSWRRGPRRRKSMAGGKHYSAPPPQPHAKYIDTRTSIYLYPYISLNFSYYTNIIAYIHTYTYIFCLILTLTASTHAALNSGRRVGISPLLQKILRFNHTNLRQRKRQPYRGGICAPSPPHLTPSPPGCPPRPSRARVSPPQDAGTGAGRWRGLGWVPPRVGSGTHKQPPRILETPPP